MSEQKKSNKQDQLRAKNKLIILDAARTEFVLNGYKGASVQQISQRSGLPKANVLYYYKNKEALYHAVLESTLEMWDEGIGDILYEDGPAIAIEKFIASKVRMSFTAPEASKIYALEIIQGAQHLKEFARSYLRQWVREKASIFQRWIDEGQMDDIDPTQLIFLIWSSTQHYADFETQILTVLNQAEFEEKDEKAVTRFLTNMVLKGCGIAQHEH
ncbi:TetR/AcrR family transcriptional regulator [Thalassotalea agarivorans]|uniref:Transcriptional regulator, TetR family n=2 Tax=Thalassotalea agarivorans TaxID=349064 RepID=A0A1I0DDF1_THASX|nr:TetR/AcrR family transcriptional regulator [Thalassotalea agarivorans]SET30372.1 transcriptional regulator, TetR family [Thalassotalea agarivorans]